MEPCRGMIVKSIAGHDRNKNLVIKEITGDFAFICDGHERKLEKPKKKRLKHLRLTNTVIELSDLTDKKLKTILREYTEG